MKSSKGQSDWSEGLPLWLRAPLLLQPNNFTPLTRTPWGGQVIGERYKRELVPAARGQHIGESWEFSCDPAFPSRFVPNQGPEGELLALIERYPEAILSPELVRAKGVSCEILLKLLDAAEPLSLQVHPADGDRFLTPDECGKPESWLILAAAPGAGIYLGFSRTVSRDDLRLVLNDGDKAKELLNFVPVKPGDFFSIEPGVTHAIGAGVTVLEPQRILTGKTGKTYRLWDWGRRYDKNGQLDQVHGQPRALHVEASLQLIDPQRQVGAAYVDTLRRLPRISTLAGGISVREFPANPYYKTLLCAQPVGTELRLSIEGGYGALLMLSGRVSVLGKTLMAGQPCLLPHYAMPLTFKADLSSEFAVLAPASATIGCSDVR